MNLELENYGRADLVTLPKQLVMANAPDARNAIKDLIRQGHTRLVLDLQAVDFVDSSGLSVLVSTLKAAQAEKGEVVLLGPTDGVRSLIELTRLHKVFEIYDDRQAAVQRLN